jgi:hypothetical protein
MPRSSVAGVLLIAGTATLGAACLYGVPDVIEDPGASATTTTDASGDASGTDCPRCAKILASGNGSLTELLVHESSAAYFAVDGRQIMSAGVTAPGEPKMLASSIRPPFLAGVTPAGMLVYWEGSDHINALNVAGGTPQRLVTNGLGGDILGRGVDVATQSVVAIGGSNREVRRISYAGGTNEVLTLRGVDIATRPRLSAGRAHWIEGTSVRTFANVNLATKAVAVGSSGVDDVVYGLREGIGCRSTGAPPSTISFFFASNFSSFGEAGETADAVTACALGPNETVFFTERSGALKFAPRLLTPAAQRPTTTYPTVVTPDGPLDIKFVEPIGAAQAVVVAGDAAARWYIARFD